MSYTHSGKQPITLSRHPIDPDSSDWVFFVYEDYLREGETITAHEAIVDGGDIVVASTYIGTLPDESGTDVTQVYGVKVKPSAYSNAVSVTLRISTATAGEIDLGRSDIDRTVIIPVKDL